MTKAAFIYDEGFGSGLRLDPDLTVSQWSDRYRVLSQIASSEPGKWRTDRTPYLKEIMDCLSPSSPVEKVVFMKGVQCGASESGCNWLGYIIDQAPGPTLMVQPTVEMAKRLSKGRIAPMIEHTSCIRKKVKEARSRDSGNTVQSKEFPGGVLVITGANSAVGLRSMPVRYLFLDEIDGYPGDVDGEGDPVSLAVARTATFSRRKIFMTSTPTIQGLSRIELEYETTDKRLYHVPCPGCFHFQPLRWERMVFDDGAGAQYRCENCEMLIGHHHKTTMLSQGRWIATAPGDGKTAGFHLSGLYSPVGWFSWDDAVRQYQQAKEDDKLLKVWTNTVLGQSWVDKGEAPDWQRLFDRAEGYTQIPDGGLLLTAGADVQKDRIEVEVVAWGKDKQSWSVDYVVLPGDPAKASIWQALSDLLDKCYPHENGTELSITMLAIDSGYATQEVYGWVRRYPHNRVMAVKGVESGAVPLGLPKRVDVTTRGKTLKAGCRVWMVGVSILKSELYHWLNVTRDEDGHFPSGYCHFPKYDPEYFKQLTAEQLVSKVVKGYTKREWQKTRDRNEALDCRVYARAASIAIGMDRWNARKWQQIEEQVGVGRNTTTHRQEIKSLRRRKRKTKTRSKFMS